MAAEFDLASTLVTPTERLLGLAAPVKASPSKRPRGRSLATCLPA
jgi:hypothetical protein